MSKIETIISSIASEKNLNTEEVLQTVKTAVTRTAKSLHGFDLEFRVEIDTDDKALKLYQVIEVIPDADYEILEDDKKQAYVSITEAKEVDPELEIGDKLTYEMSFEEFGRTGAAKLNYELEFHIQRLLEDKILKKFEEKVGSIITGVVIQVDEFENTYIEIDEVRAKLPQKNRIKGESFKVGDTVKSILRKVYITRNQGIIVELSRTTPQFLEALLALEVPEISDGSIEIKKSARIPGVKAKIVLESENERVDAIGATVGVKGVRISSVSKELNDENIDCIKYSESPEIFLLRALTPAQITNVLINEEENKAIVSLPPSQKSKAIGKSGVNVRLASMLTGYEINFKDSEENAPTTQEDTDKSALAALFKE